MAKSVAAVSTALSVFLAFAGAARAVSCPGPDAGGYTCFVRLGEVDPFLPTATVIDFAADPAPHSVGLSCPLTLFWIDYPAIRVSPHGWVGGQGPVSGDDACPPSGLSASPVIFGVWDDLVPGTGTVTHDTFGPPGDCVFAVTWEDVKHRLAAPGDPGATFQIQIYQPLPCGQASVRIIVASAPTHDASGHVTGMEDPRYGSSLAAVCGDETGYTVDIQLDSDVDGIADCLDPCQDDPVNRCAFLLRHATARPAACPDVARDWDRSGTFDGGPRLSVPADLLLSDLVARGVTEKRVSRDGLVRRPGSGESFVAYEIAWSAATLRVRRDGPDVVLSGW